MKFKLFFIGFFVVISSYTFAQKTAAECYNAAMQFVKENKNIEALKLFKKATVLNKNYYDAYYQAGLLFIKYQNGPDAVSCFTSAAKLKPKNNLAFVQLGNLYKDVIRKNDSAVYFYKKALALKADTSAMVLYNVAWCYNAEKNYDSAIVYGKKSIVVDLQFKAPYHELSYAYKQSNKLDDALDFFTKNYELSKLDLSLYFVGMIYNEQGKKDKALEVVDKLNAIQSKFGEPLLKRINAKKQ